MIPFLLTLTLLAQAPSADRIIGTWNTPNGESKIEIVKCAEAYCGSIKSLAKVGAKDGHNADASLRGRPLLGLQILKGFRHQEPDTWTDGTLYAPERGRDVSPKLVLTGPDTLEVRISVGIVKKTVAWTRVK